MKHSIMKFAAALALLAGLSSCMGVPDIPEDMSPKELVQKGQDSFENGNHKAANAYYNALLERYGSDPAYYAEAKYEMAHILVKRKKYKEAVPVLEDLLALYKRTQPGLLPPTFYKLAEVDYEKIPEKFKAKGE